MHPLDPPTSPAMAQNPICAGLDGCRNGWVLALWQPRDKKLSLHLLAGLSAIAALAPRPHCVVVDMPLVLAPTAQAGGRACDKQARALLPTARKSSIFSAPTAAALTAWRQGGDYAAVLAAQRQTALGAPGLSLQAFHLLKHIDALQIFVAQVPELVCIEGHPELAFNELRGQQNTALASKHTAAGRQQRQNILTHLHMDWAAAWTACERRQARPVVAAMDDILDACIMAHVAHKLSTGRAQATDGRVANFDDHAYLTEPAIYR